MAILTIRSKELTVAVRYFDISNTVVVSGNAARIYSVVDVTPEALALIIHFAELIIMSRVVNNTGKMGYFDVPEA
jgi:hypothetical protein